MEVPPDGGLRENPVDEWMIWGYPHVWTTPMCEIDSSYSSEWILTTCSSEKHGRVRQVTPLSRFESQMLHVWYIYRYMYGISTYIWMMFGVNVGKYSIPHRIHVWYIC